MYNIINQVTLTNHQWYQDCIVSQIYDIIGHFIPHFLWFLHDIILLPLLISVPKSEIRVNWVIHFSARVLWNKLALSCEHKRWASNILGFSRWEARFGCEETLSCFALSGIRGGVEWDQARAQQYTWRETMWQQGLLRAAANANSRASRGVAQVSTTPFLQRTHMQTPTPKGATPTLTNTPDSPKACVHAPVRLRVPVNRLVFVYTLAACWYSCHEEKAF